MDGCEDGCDDGCDDGCQVISIHEVDIHTSHTVCNERNAIETTVSVRSIVHYSTLIRNFVALK